MVELDAGGKIDFPVAKSRQAYLVQIEGSSVVIDVHLEERDALEILEEDITITAQSKSHNLVIEMKKPQ